MSSSSNSADDYTQVNAEVLKPMAKAGVCVIGIDHANKDPETHAYGPTGTQAKARSVGGAMYLVKVERTYIMGQGGASTVLNTKDRPGGVKPHCRKNLRNKRTLDAGLFELEPDGDSLSLAGCPRLGASPSPSPTTTRSSATGLRLPGSTLTGVETWCGRTSVTEQISPRASRRTRSSICRGCERRLGGERPSAQRPPKASFWADPPNAWAGSDECAGRTMFLPAQSSAQTSPRRFRPASPGVYEVAPGGRRR